jgi:death-on-curing protein
MRFLSLTEVLALHRRVIVQAQGRASVRDLGALQSAIAQPRATFEGEDLYPTLEGKAVALGFSIIRNHPFTDGNKRVGHAAMETMLLLNGLEIEASDDDGEKMILAVAAGTASREELLAWVKARLVKSAN